MSIFSEQLRAAIEESNVAIADLAEQTGLSISMLYKIQSGARQVDSMETLETLLDGISCSISQRKGLLSSYVIEKVGSIRFSCFQELKGFINDIGELVPDIRKLTAPDTLELPNAINGSKNVNAAIATLVNREALRDGGRINMMVPLNHGYCLDCVTQAVSGSVSGFRGVIHLFCLKSSRTDDALLYNMKAIRVMLPRMLNVPKYDIRYGYIADPDDTATLFPFYIITSDGVLLMNRMLTSAVFIDDPGSCELYRNSFRTISGQFRPVMHTGSGTIEDILATHHQMVSGFKKHPVVISMGAQPSVLPCLSPDRAINYLPAGASKNPDTMSAMETFFRRSSSTEFITFFTTDGLHHMFETGEVLELIGPQAPRFSRKDILDALEGLIRRAKQGTAFPYLFRENVFPSKSRITFGLYGTKICVVCEIPSRNEVFVDVTEATLARVVKDYADNALLLGDVFSIEETIRILEHELQIFRKEIP